MCACVLLFAYWILVVCALYVYWSGNCLSLLMSKFALLIRKSSFVPVPSARIFWKSFGDGLRNS